MLIDWSMIVCLSIFFLSIYPFYLYICACLVDQWLAFQLDHADDDDDDDQDKLRRIFLILFFTFFSHAYPETAYITATPTGTIGPITVSSIILPNPYKYSDVNNFLFF